jgi:hypothetical protein
MRAARDGQAAISQLRSAAQVAAAHGGIGLLRRCQRDRDVRQGFLAPLRAFFRRHRPNAGPNAARTVQFIPSDVHRISNDAAEGDDVTTSPGSATVAYQELTAAVRGDLIMPRDPGHDDAPPQAGQPETGRRRWAVLAVVPTAQFLTILDPWVVNIALPVLQHDFCPSSAVGRLADPRCVRRPTRRATAVRGAGDPTARQDRGCRDVPKPGSSLRTAGSSRSCDRG